MGSQSRRDSAATILLFVLAPEWAHRVRTQNIIYVKGKYENRGPFYTYTCMYTILHIDVHFFHVPYLHPAAPRLQPPQKR